MICKSSIEQCLSGFAFAAGDDIEFEYIPDPDTLPDRMKYIAESYIPGDAGLLLKASANGLVFQPNHRTSPYQVYDETKKKYVPKI